MRRSWKRLLMLLLFLFPFWLAAQSSGEGGSPPSGEKKSESPISRRAQRKADRKKWKEFRKKRKAERKAVKQHHKRIQDKQTLKRMKNVRKTSIRSHEHRREFFLKRWFKKK
jgi:hypothetical protein